MPGSFIPLSLNWVRIYLCDERCNIPVKEDGIYRFNHWKWYSLYGIAVKVLTVGWKCFFYCGCAVWLVLSETALWLDTCVIECLNNTWRSLYTVSVPYIPLSVNFNMYFFLYFRWRLWAVSLVWCQPGLTFVWVFTSNLRWVLNTSKQVMIIE